MTFLSFKYHINIQFGRINIILGRTSNIGANPENHFFFFLFVPILVIYSSSHATTTKGCYTLNLTFDMNTSPIYINFNLHIWTIIINPKKEKKEPSHHLKQKN